MKKEVTQYFCDICGEEIPGGASSGALTLFKGSIRQSFKEHVCPACYRVIEE